MITYLLWATQEQNIINGDTETTRKVCELQNTIAKQVSEKEMKYIAVASWVVVQGGVVNVLADGDTQISSSPVTGHGFGLLL